MGAEGHKNRRTTLIVLLFFTDIFFYLNMSFSSAAKR